MNLKQVLKAELEAQQRNNAQMRAHLERFALMRDDLEQGANRSESHLVLCFRFQIWFRILCFDDQKVTKNTAGNFFYLSLIKNAIYLSLCRHKGCPSYNPQKMKFINFSIFLGHCCPPGSGSRLLIRIQVSVPHRIRIQSGSTTLLVTIEMLH